MLAFFCAHASPYGRALFSVLASSGGLTNAQGVRIGQDAASGSDVLFGTTLDNEACSMAIPTTIKL